MTLNIAQKAIVADAFEAFFTIISFLPWACKKKKKSYCVISVQDSSNNSCGDKKVTYFAPSTEVMGWGVFFVLFFFSPIALGKRYKLSSADIKLQDNQEIRPLLSKV